MKEAVQSIKSGTKWGVQQSTDTQIQMHFSEIQIETKQLWKDKVAFSN